MKEKKRTIGEENMVNQNRDKFMSLFDRAFESAETLFKHNPKYLKSREGIHFVCDQAPLHVTFKMTGAELTEVVKCIPQQEEFWYFIKPVNDGENGLLCTFYEIGKCGCRCSPKNVWDALESRGARPRCNLFNMVMLEIRGGLTDRLIMKYLDKLMKLFDKKEKRGRTHGKKKI